MKYVSTRGITHSPTSFEQVLFSGYAPDGGLFVPESIPIIPSRTLDLWRSKCLSYPQVVENILKYYISQDEVPDDDLAKILEKAYARFEQEEIVPIRKVKDGVHEVSVVELFHGPTKSFKDYALLIVGQLMSYFLQKRKTHTTILVGTSGDTGSAAIQAVRGLENVNIIVLYPKGQVSQVQELQMLTVLDSNVQLFQVEGTSDDLDIPISQCFPDSRLSSTNSINWARIMVQIAHYVYVYLRNSQNDSEQVNIIVPSGAGGNLIAGVYACRMGFPINLYVATNENQCLHNAIANGAIELFNKVVQTPANAMDIQNPYNLERLLHISSCTPPEIIQFMTLKGTHLMNSETLTNIRRFVKGSSSVTNDQIFETMRTVWESNKIVICPHTATAFYYWKKLQKLEGKWLVISTASPDKFIESIRKLGIGNSLLNGNGLLAKLMELPKATPKVMQKGDNWFEILQSEIDMINNSKDNPDQH